MSPRSAVRIVRPRPWGSHPRDQRPRQSTCPGTETRPHQGIPGRCLARVARLTSAGRHPLRPPLDLVERLDSFPMIWAPTWRLRHHRPAPSLLRPRSSGPRKACGHPVQQGRRRRSGPGQDGHPRPRIPLGRLETSTSSAAHRTPHPPLRPTPDDPPPTEIISNGDPSGCSSSSRPASATSPPSAGAGLRRRHRRIALYRPGRWRPR